MRKIVDYQIGIFLILLVTSCSTTVDFHGSTNIFTPPETSGKIFGIMGQVGFGNSTKFVLSTLEQKSIFSSQIIVNENSGMIKDNNVNSYAALGVVPEVDIYYRFLGDSPGPFGVKWQIVGEGATALSSGYKLSVFAGLAPTYTDKGSLEAQNGSGTKRRYDSNLKVGMCEFGTSFGYRFTDYALVYMAPFYRKYDSRMRLTSQSYSEVYRKQGAIVKGVGVGGVLNMGKVLYLNMESGYAHSQYSNSNQRDDYTLGLAIGLNSFN